MDISIIIPNYNGEKILSKNLQHVLAAVKEYKKETLKLLFLTILQLIIQKEL